MMLKRMVAKSLSYSYEALVHPDDHHEAALDHGLGRAPAGFISAEPPNLQAVGTAKLLCQDLAFVPGGLGVRTGAQHPASAIQPGAGLVPAQGKEPWFLAVALPASFDRLAVPHGGTWLHVQSGPEQLQAPPGSAFLEAAKERQSGERQRAFLKLQPWGGRVRGRDRYHASESLQTPGSAIIEGLSLPKATFSGHSAIAAAAGVASAVETPRRAQHAARCHRDPGSAALGLLLNKGHPVILARAAGSAQKPGKLNDIIWVPLTDGISTQTPSAGLSAKQKSVAGEQNGGVESISSFGEPPITAEPLVKGASPPFSHATCVHNMAPPNGRAAQGREGGSNWDGVDGWDGDDDRDGNDVWDGNNGQGGDEEK
ncbi:hypothetical protein Anapl_04103 [Anas platyrhynchos]|uniref:Uncharacterized protein n=1 Tax=Anas platyrhynchos TaxID=8839 RepID=R0JVH9_ANAPL|nr:hypothetical protein Anapl_04103 [Anas platyrhynchos]